MSMMMIVMMKINRAKICDAKIRGFPRPAEGLIPLKLSCLECRILPLFLKHVLNYFYIYSISNTDLQYCIVEQGKNILCYYLSDYLRIDFESVMERATNKISKIKYKIYII